MPKFVSDRTIEAVEYWREFRRASRNAQEIIQDAMVKLADSGACEVDEQYGAELRRILGTLPQLPSPVVSELPYVPVRFGR